MCMRRGSLKRGQRSPATFLCLLPIIKLIRSSTAPSTFSTSLRFASLGLMLRSLKKLKLWSFLKKRAKPSRCSCSAPPPLLAEPSAPPLPPPRPVSSYQQYLLPSPVFTATMQQQEEGVYCGCFTGVATLSALLRCCCLCCLHQWP